LLLIAEAIASHRRLEVDHIVSSTATTTVIWAYYEKRNKDDSELVRQSANS
jgi:hypothetical protein